MPPQKIALLTDSCADLTPRLVAENHIHVCRCAFCALTESTPTV